jgi:hypothetical protein
MIRNEIFNPNTRKHQERQGLQEIKMIVGSKRGWKLFTPRPTYNVFIHSKCNKR